MPTATPQPIRLDDYAPPPYLIDLHSRLGRLGRVLLRLDERIARWPVARDSGDHFLMVLTKRR